LINPARVPGDLTLNKLDSDFLQNIRMEPTREEVYNAQPEAMSRLSFPVIDVSVPLHGQATRIQPWCSIICCRLMDRKDGITGLDCAE
jgi:hypothetical protein